MLQMKTIKSGLLFVELFVGMGKMVAWWHQMALGFELKGKRVQMGAFGMEISYWLKSGDANLIITSAMEPAAQDLVSFVDRHGNSIKRFSLEVSDIEETHTFLKLNQAIFLSDGIEEKSHGEERSHLIRCKLFDDNELVFVQRTDCKGLMPGFEPISESNQKLSSNIVKVDHLASVVRINESEFWNAYLCRLLDLQQVQTIGEEFFANLLTGMKMNVLQSEKSGFIKVIVEPLPEKTKQSQVDVFLKHNFGTGIQHLAFEVHNLMDTVKDLKNRGVAFTPIPDKYYASLAEEHPELPIEDLKKANILCEKDGDKMLFQVFTEPIGDRPTLFYEFIQRVNDYDGFGAKNVRQLFKSLEAQVNG